MNPRDLMPSRTLRLLLLALILMTVALLAAPRGADAALVIKVAGTSTRVVPARRDGTVVVTPRTPRVAVAVRPPARHVLVAHRHGSQTIVKCRGRLDRRSWVPGRWEHTGPRTSRWIPGHWRMVRRG